MDKDIKNIALKYNTDKVGHGYMELYDKHLPANPKKMLEIGVLKGESIRMWKEIFPECEIHGLDLFSDNPIPKIEGVVFHKGSQTDPHILSKLRCMDFDLIIDDGSHNSRDQLITFFGLFNGKHYFVEDLHCCDEEYFRQGLPGLMTMKKLTPHLPCTSILLSQKLALCYLTSRI